MKKPLRDNTVDGLKGEIERDSEPCPPSCTSFSDYIYKSAGQLSAANQHSGWLKEERAP